MADSQTPQTPIDYMALAKQAGATDSRLASSSPQNAGVDYMALAKQAGATDSQPASQTMVTNSAGETMPADVAARHARSAADADARGINRGDKPGPDLGRFAGYK